MAQNRVKLLLWQQNKQRSNVVLLLCTCVCWILLAKLSRTKHEKCEDYWSSGLNAGLKTEKYVLLFSFWNVKSILFCHLFAIGALKSVNWHVKLLLTIFSMYKAFCKSVIFLSSLYVMSTTIGTWFFSVGKWKTWEAALCQAISSRIHFTYCQINDLSGVVMCHSNDMRSIRWKQGTYSQQSPAICLTLSIKIFFGTEHPLSV